MLKKIKKIFAVFICSWIVVYSLTGCKTDKVIVLDSLDSSALSGSGLGESKEESDEEGRNAEVTTDISTQTEQLGQELICVYVCGYVVSPGVYYLEEGSRVADALSSAGGFSDEADTVIMNLAALISDGQKLYFPSRQEVLDGIDVSECSTGGTVTVGEKEEGSINVSKININTASKTELMQLPNIGEAKAQAIVSYRENVSRFVTCSDIKNVSGIGDGLYNQIIDYICVD